jgi:hypothetical protein
MVLESSRALWDWGMGTQGTMVPGKDTGYPGWGSSMHLLEGFCHLMRGVTSSANEIETLTEMWISGFAVPAWDSGRVPHKEKG